MSEAAKLAMSLANNDGPPYPKDDTAEPHIVIHADRTIEVPDELKHIAVQYDHNIETVTFDCPKYWDDKDLSLMNVYINYRTPDGKMGMATAGNVKTDTSDDSMMHFTWTIDKYVTQVVGYISFLVCAKSKTVDEDGEATTHWNSELCENEMYVSEGLEGESHAIETYPEIINNLLSRMEDVIDHHPKVSCKENTGGGYDITIKNIDEQSKTITVRHGTDGTDGKDGTNGTNGATFTPSVSDTGLLSWTNNGGLTNPVSRNVKGPKGDQGDPGEPGGMIDLNTGERFDAFIGTPTAWDEWQKAGNSTDNVLFLPVGDENDPTPDYVTVDDLNGYVTTEALSGYGYVTSDALKGYAPTSNVSPKFVKSATLSNTSKELTIASESGVYIFSKTRYLLRYAITKVERGTDTISSSNQIWDITFHADDNIIYNGYSQYIPVGCCTDTGSLVFIKFYQTQENSSPVLHFKPFVAGDEETAVYLTGSYTLYQLGTQQFPTK